MYTEKKTIFIDGSSGTARSAHLRPAGTARGHHAADPAAGTRARYRGAARDAQPRGHRVFVSAGCGGDHGGRSGRKPGHGRARHLDRAPHRAGLGVRLPGAVARARGRDPNGQAHRRARLPRQRLRRAHLSARRGGHPAAGRTADMLLAHGLQRRRQEDDRRI